MPFLSIFVFIRSLLYVNTSSSVKSLLAQAFTGLTSLFAHNCYNQAMKTDFTDRKAGERYLSFSQSDEGQQQHALIWDAVSPMLPENSDIQALDLGCGDGWLTEKLAARFAKVTGLDSSPALVEYARKNNPSAEYVEADALDTKLEEKQFNLIIASLIVHDFPDLTAIYKEIKRLLKPGGQLIMIELNQYYAYPVGSWRRNWLERIFRLTPSIKLKNYGEWTRKKDRLFRWWHGSSYFYSLPEMINAALATGLTLNNISDTVPSKDGNPLDITYRSHRFPVFIILKFRS